MSVSASYVMSVLCFMITSFVCARARVCVCVCIYLGIWLIVRAGKVILVEVLGVKDNRTSAVSSH